MIMCKEEKIKRAFASAIGLGMHRVGRADIGRIRTPGLLIDRNAMSCDVCCVSVSKSREGKPRVSFHACSNWEMQGTEWDELPEGVSLWLYPNGDGTL